MNKVILKIITILIALVFYYCARTQKTIDENSNLFSPSTTIEYNIDRDQNVSLIIYDIEGNPIDTLVNSLQTRGNYKLTPNLMSYEAGLYFYKFKSEDTTYTRKMMLVK
jgi:hypothetical protein